mmetsp:Transcript_5103/g.7384  ORF Transcript_5103/g.7384 Transcript_5103/m.7384 type:complete len:354 (+) Transcript_5103:77-1138(+)
MSRNIENTKHSHSSSNIGEDDEGFMYRTGIPTLRSAAHTVKYSTKRSKGREHDKPFAHRGKNGRKNVSQSIHVTQNTNDEDSTNLFQSCLPLSVREEHVFSYDLTTYNLQQAVIKMLRSADEDIVGGWENSENKSDESYPLESNCNTYHTENKTLLLEDLRLPVDTLSRKAYGGKCEDAQKYLANLIAEDQEFMDTFDKFVLEVVIPWFKSLLSEHKAIDHLSKTEFYYQRPPTLRIQPGPSKSIVKSHKDADYGHQDGELNFWIPLVNLEKAGNTYLWVESEPESGDYHPIVVKFGEIASFHGSFCRHYVPANSSIYTRVSMDFRIGVEGKFDPDWQMIGTRADHNRRKVVA